MGFSAGGSLSVRAATLFAKKSYIPSVFELLPTYSEADAN